MAPITRIGRPPADDGDAGDDQRRKDDLGQRHAERGDAERPAPLALEGARRRGRLDMDHQALPGEAEQIEGEEQA